MPYGIKPKHKSLIVPNLCNNLPTKGAKTTTPKEGKVINQPGEKPKFLCCTIPDSEGAITVPTMIVKLLTNSMVNIPMLAIFFIQQNSRYSSRSTLPIF